MTDQPRPPASGSPDEDLQLTPTEDLLLDLIGARHRLLDTPYHLGNRHLRTLRSLCAKGLIGYDSGMVPATQKVWLTEAGVQAAISPDHVPPALSPVCLSAYFGPRSGGFRVDCEKRNHHGGKHRAAWYGLRDGEVVPIRVKWVDAEAWGRDDERYAHLFDQGTADDGSAAAAPAAPGD